MTAYRLNKRGVLFGIEDGRAVRADFASDEIINPAVTDAGLPVPVVFGCRLLDPTVVAWATLADQQIQYYDREYQKFIGDFYLRLRPDESIVVTNPGTVLVRMYLLSMRMVLCAGKIDYISSFYAKNIPFVVHGTDAPDNVTTYGPDELKAVARSRLAQIKRWTNSQRAEVSISDADMFGGREGGLGVPIYRNTYSAQTQMCEFWINDGIARTNIATEPVLDLDTGARGVTSLLFKTFNFGGSPGLPPWKVAVTRVYNQTARVTDPQTKAQTYKEQWQPQLASISSINVTGVDGYYMIVVDVTMSADQLTEIKDYVLSLPYDGVERTTAYRIVTLPYQDCQTVINASSSRYLNDPGGGGVTAGTTFVGKAFWTHEFTRTTNVQLFGPYPYSTVVSYSNVPTRFDLTTSIETVASNFDELIRAARRRNINPRRFAKRVSFSTGIYILRTYGNDMNTLTRSAKNTRVNSVVIFSMTNIIGSVGPEPFQFGAPAFHDFYDDAIVKFKFPVPYEDPDSPPANYVPLLTPLQYAGLNNSPPEVKVWLAKYDVSQIRTNRGALFNADSETAAPLERINAIDSHNSPTILFNDDAVVGLPSTRVNNEIGALRPIGGTMNPVHALRECLIDAEWGEGIPEGKIDEDSFLLAANTCYREELDFCYVHKAQGNVNKLINAITDYIDGVVYYEAATDRMVLRLIREDYRIDSLLAFNETNIATITNYRRQHTDERTNSVTVRFHEASKGATSTMTVHDVDAATRAGGVITQTLNYDGCATQTAAQLVAVRELNALSKPLISFTALVNPPAGRHIGLGEPLVFSYVDLGISRVVMRVSSIDYGDGLTGGITLNLIQDVYANLELYDRLIEPDELKPPEYTEDDLLGDVKFKEAGWTRIRTSAGDLTPPITDPATVTVDQAYVMAGLKFRPDRDDQAVATSSGRPIPTIIGLLLSPIFDSYVDPRTDQFSIDVLIGSMPPTVSHLMIDDELFAVNSWVWVEQNRRVSVNIGRRAIADTVAKPHGFNADVWFMDSSWLQYIPYQAGRLLSVASQQDVYTNRQLVEIEDVPNVGRIARPLPPYYVSVAGCSSSDLRIDGDILLEFQPKFEAPWDDDRQPQTLIKLSFDGNEPNVRTVSPIKGANDYQVQRYTISKADIRAYLMPFTNELETSFQLSVGSRYIPDPGAPTIFVDSWQTWDFNIDWSFEPRQYGGWNFDWGNDWGGGDLVGWGYDWDEHYGN